jgi:uncharacterized protein YggU (UPF0235/DUF167 family)
VTGSSGAAVLDLIVTPRAAANAVGPFLNGILRVRVTRSPADGDANRAVVRLVADALRIAPSQIVFLAGQSSRRKRVRIEGLSPGGLARRLADASEEWR